MVKPGKLFLIDRFIDKCHLIPQNFLAIVFWSFAAGLSAAILDPIAREGIDSGSGTLLTSMTGTLIVISCLLFLCAMYRNGEELRRIQYLRQCYDEGEYDDFPELKEAVENYLCMREVNREED